MSYAATCATAWALFATCALLVGGGFAYAEAVRHGTDGERRLALGIVLGGMALAPVATWLTAYCMIRGAW